VKQLKESELIVNKNGSIYHLGLVPEQVYPMVITVGDPNRVDMVSRYFDAIDYTVINREFKSVGGRLGDQKFMVISTGIGTDNIDIVLNELAILSQYDLVSRTAKEEIKSLKIIRLGTSGSVQENLPIDSIVYSKYAVAMESLFHYYVHSFDELTFLDRTMPVIPCSSILESYFKSYPSSLTATSCGFYGPQFRSAQLDPKYTLSQFSKMTYKGDYVGNIEMETAGIYGLSKLLGFEAISINAILANRITGEYSNQPHQVISSMIDQALEILCQLK